MKIEIETEGFSANAGLRRFVRRRIDFAFSTRSDQVDRVLVRVADIGSVDSERGKICQVQVVMPGLPALVLENQESNLYVAIHRAVDRAGWTAARKLERQRRSARMIVDQRQSDRAA